MTPFVNHPFATLTGGHGGPGAAKPQPKIFKTRGYAAQDREDHEG